MTTIRIRHLKAIFETSFSAWVAVSLLPGALNASEIGAPPAEPEEVVAWLAEHWKESGWGAGGGKNYMRALDDSGWKARMLAMQQLVKLGDRSVPALTGALNGDNPEMQIFAAQTFGYLPEDAPTDILAEHLKNNKNTSVRLYAADALGMHGGKDFHPLFEALRKTEKNGDVKKHLGYAIERNGKAIDPAIIDRLKQWDSGVIDSAEVGKPAPDLELKTLNGETLQLSQYRGKSTVVLVFVYGDT